MQTLPPNPPPIEDSIITTGVSSVEPLRSTTLQLMPLSIPEPRTWSPRLATPQEYALNANSRQSGSQAEKEVPLLINPTPWRSERYRLEGGLSPAGHGPEGSSGRPHPHHRAPAEGRGEDVNEECEQATANVKIEAHKPPVQDEQRAHAENNHNNGHSGNGSRAQGRAHAKFGRRGRG